MALTPRQRAELTRAATRREAERNRSARSQKEHIAMKNEPEAQSSSLDTALFIVALVVIVVLGTGLWQVGVQ